MAAQLASGRLLLKNKHDVGNKVYDVLNEWAKTVPSVLTLKTWERQSTRALNELFIDLHDRSPHWPVMLWDTYADDGPSPADDLGKLITRLVARSEEHTSELQSLLRISYAVFCFNNTKIQSHLYHII